MIDAENGSGRHRKWFRNLELAARLAEIKKGTEKDTCNKTTGI